MHPLLEKVDRLLSQRALAVVVGLCLLFATVFFGKQVHQHYPIEHWLFWHYFAAWLATLAFGAACMSSGLLVLDRVFRVRYPLFEHALLAFTLGLLVFEWAAFLLGALQAYRKPTFFLLPFALFTAGFEEFRRFARRVHAAATRARPRRPSLLRNVVIGLGCVAFVMIYFTLLTPENVQFDSRWKHMALAEDYVAHGGIRKSTEGWVFAARPHITSYLYAWAFLMPKAKLFDHMVLCQHLEFFTFLVTTVLGVSAVAQRLVPRADATMVWAARFLFPGVFLYDSSLSGGTDHFGALYGPAIALVLFRALRDLGPRVIALLATLLAGAVLVKETVALLLVPFPILALAVRVAIELVRRFRGSSTPQLQKRLWQAPAIGVAVALAVSAPLWLKNIVLYGDPLYPNLAHIFPADPWSEAAAYRFKWSYSERLMWSPSRDWDGFVETLRALFTYSFVPNDWARSHGKVPVFGSLFTLLLVVLPFLKKTGRIWLLVAWIHVGIFAWYSVHHQDRYLQGIVPLMAAVVAAILVLIWHSFGPLVRAAAASLVALQVIWGGDVYFIQTHAMVRSPVKRVVDLISGGYEKKYEQRFQVQERFQKIGELVPRRARVLFHELHPHLGVGAESALDSYQWQSGIEYGAQKTPEGVRAMLRRLGITHVHYTPGRGNGVPSIASDVLFHEFVTFHAEKHTRVPGGMLVTVPDRPSTIPYRDSVLVLTCGGEFPASGLYKTATLDVFQYGPKGEDFGKPEKAAADHNDAVQYLPEAQWVIFQSRCFRNRPPRDLAASFEVMVKRRGDPREFWRRRESTPNIDPGPAGDAPADETDGAQQ